MNEQNHHKDLATFLSSVIEKMEDKHRAAAIVELVINRISEDHAFKLRILNNDNEAAIFRAMFYGERFDEMERWLNRRTLEVVR